MADDIDADRDDDGDDDAVLNTVQSVLDFSSSNDMMGCINMYNMLCS
jgi:hypothetical protein